MKNKLFFVIFLCSSIQAQISQKIIQNKILNPDEADHMTINWKCHSESYPSASKLPDFKAIEFSIKNNGEIRISPNIFEDKSQILSKITIDYKDCINNFLIQVKESFDQQTKNCSVKKN